DSLNLDSKTLKEQMIVEQGKHKYLLGSRLGRGGFGYVCKGTDLNVRRPKNLDVVVKMIPIERGLVDELDNQKLLDHFWFRVRQEGDEDDGKIYPRECFFLDKLRGKPGIVQLSTYFQDECFVYIILVPVQFSSSIGDFMAG